MTVQGQQMSPKVAQEPGVYAYPSCYPNSLNKVSEDLGQPCGDSRILWLGEDLEFLPAKEAARKPPPSSLGHSCLNCGVRRE